MRGTGEISFNSMHSSSCLYFVKETCLFDLVTFFTRLSHETKPGHMSSSSWVQIRCLHPRGSDWLRAHLPLRERILRVIKRAITMTILIALMATLGRSWRSTFGNAGSFCQWRNELCAGKPLRNREATAREGSAPDRNRTRGLRLRRPTPEPITGHFTMSRVCCELYASLNGARRRPTRRRICGTGRTGD